MIITPIFISYHTGSPYYSSTAEKLVSKINFLGGRIKMEKLQDSMTKLTLYKQKEDFYSWVIFKKKEKNTFQQKKVIICPKTLLFT